MRRSRPVSVFLTALVALCVAVIGLTPAAYADGAAPTVTAPTTGSSVSSGWSGPVGVDFTGVTPGGYTVQVECDGAGPVASRSVTWDGTMDPGPTSTSAVNGPDSCTVSVLDQQNSSASVASTSFTVAAPVTADPAITSPTSGSTQASGWTGPVGVDFNGVLAGTYTVRVVCSNAGWVASRGVTWDGTTDPGPTYANPVQGPDSCTASVLDQQHGNATVASSGFAVDEPPVPPTPPLDFSFATLSAPYFYPVVTDGYRDTVNLSWYQNRDAGITFSVLDSYGRTLRSASYSGAGAGHHTLGWNGRDRTGTRVRAGYYKLLISGSGASFAKTVQVRTALVSHQNSVLRSGDVSSLSHSGDCYTDRYDWGDGYPYTELDCWGGHYGRASYTFGLPSSTYAVSVAVSGDYPVIDFCCRGRVYRSAGWLRTGVYRVNITATGWRAYDIYGVRVTYSYRTRI